MKKDIAIGLLFFLIVPAFSIAQTIGGGDITFRPKNANAVMFSHEAHVNVKGVKCTGCHYHVFQMAKNSYKMDMTKITKGEFCGKCHNGQRSFDVKDDKNCQKCHK